MLWKYLLGGIIALTVAGNASIRADVLDPVISTLAGSGKLGMLDGPAARSSFFAPFAVAFDSVGNLLIADAGAQRIRKLSRDGNVVTIAGSGSPVALGIGVPGGYRDGAATAARFNLPTGIAVNAAGDVFVADTGNNCIRRIRNGAVSTFAGRPGESPPTDGPGSVATFRAPRSLAFDKARNLYVADVGVGIRRIDSSGIVSTIRFFESQYVVAVGVAEDGNRHVLIAATSNKFVFYDLVTKTIIGALVMAPGYRGNWPTEGLRYDSPASAIWPLSTREFVYASSLRSSVVYVATDSTYTAYYSRELGEPPLLNGQRTGGSFADGNEARFAQPMGVTASSDGRIVVADVENRRIRVIAPFDRRNFETAEFSAPKTSDRQAFRVAVVGSSLVWGDIDWAHSIEATVIRDVEAAPGFRRTGKKLEVTPIRMNGVALDAELDYVAEVVEPRPVDAIAMCFSWPTLQFGTRLGERRILTQLPGSLIDRMATIQSEATDDRRYAFAVYMPLGGNIVGQKTYTAFDPGSPLLPNDAVTVETGHDAVIESFRAKRINFVDVWPEMAAKLAAVDHEPIVSAWDVHYTASANEIVGHSIARYLIEREGWTK